MHNSKHLQREIEKLKKNILSLSARVEKSLRDAIYSFDHQSIQMAQTIIDNDTEIDLSEIRIEEECLKILALYQPVAGDLRFIVAALKINNELERIGDLAVNIAERVTSIFTDGGCVLHFDLSVMTNHVNKMFRDSINSLIYLDERLARKVLKSDDFVDQQLKSITIEIAKKLTVSNQDIQKMILYLSIPKQLERIADCTTNIAEDVIYMINGQIIRHSQQ